MAKTYRVNERIRVPSVRVIDEDGEQLGVLPTKDAIQLARERDLDLVEVAPQVEPPVCRLLDYGRFRYLQAKKDRGARRSQKLALLREVRFRPRIGQHDLDAKRRQVLKLLEEGAKVKVTVLFRGREMTHPEEGVKVLRKIAEALKDESKLEGPPAIEGRRMNIILAPVAATPNRKQDPEPKEANSPDAQAQDT